MDFRSDNVTGAHPAILEALARANKVTAMASYGADEITARSRAQAGNSVSCAGTSWAGTTS